MSSEVFASIMTGKMLNWASLVTTKNIIDPDNPPTVLIPEGTPLTTAIHTAFSHVPTQLFASDSPTETKATICRRVATSGTFASQNIRMLQRSCVSGAQAPLDSSGATGPIVMPLLSGAGDVDACLNALNNTGAYLGNGGSKWAIGHQAVDRDPTCNAGGTCTQFAYRFIKLNGVAPTYVNVANGTYKYSVTSTIQWRSDIVTGDTQKIATEIATNAASPTALGAVRIQHPFGDSGLMALAENGFAVSFTAPDGNGNTFYDTTKPVTPFTHKTTSLSNCIDPLRVGSKNIPVP